MKQQTMMNDKKIFLWVGLNQDGKMQEGEIDAVSTNLAKAYLQQQGIIVSHITKKRLLLRLKSSAISQKHITVFYRQLATLLKAGISLHQSLHILSAQQEYASLQAILQSIKKELDSGQTFSYSLRKHANYFDALSCHLIYIAEASGMLETMLLRISHHNEQKLALHYQIKQALIYPAIISIVAIIVSFILFIFVIPQFAALFATFHLELPLFTRYIVYLSEWLQQRFWFGLLLIPVSYLCWFYHKKHAASQYLIHQLILKIPLLSPLIKKYIWARFARTFATLFLAGVPIIEALNMLKNITQNSVIQAAILTLQQNIVTGKSLHQAMAANLLFPPMMTQMIQVGEESGSLDVMLEKIAEFYESETTYWLKNFSQILEPLIIIILGVLIGGLVIAMYLPIFKLGAVI